MKTYLLAINLSAAIIPQALLAQKRNEVLFESIEWTNIRIPSADKSDWTHTANDDGAEFFVAPGGMI